MIETSNHVIISLYLDRDPDNYWVEADDRLGPMVQARSDLAAGDLRLLYLGWLLGAQWAGHDDEHAEAPPSCRCRRVSGTSARRRGPSPISARSTRT